MSSKNIRRILIPVDFSETGTQALEHGAYMANVFRADINLLHIIDGITTYPVDFFSDKSQIKDKALIQAKVTERLGEYAEKFTKKYGVYVNTGVTVGNTTRKITETVKEQNIDIIVMGTHGTRGFEEFFVGSIAHKVVNLSPCPVITVQKQSKAPGFSTIVLPIDDTIHSRQKVSNILPIAAKYKSTVHLLGLLNSTDKSEIAKFNIKLNTAEEAIKKYSLSSVRKIVKGSNLAETAMKYAEEVNADLLAIMTDHESNMTGMFMGAFAKTIVNHSKIPVLSVKPVTGPYEAMG